MYAIIRTGGKQYRVEAGDTLRVETLEAELGSELDLKDILVVGGEKIFVGEPTLNNAKVTVVVTRQAKAPKIIVFKKKRRQGYRRMQGHRQMFTELFVKSITSPEGQVVTAQEAAQVFNPEKKLEKKQKTEELRKEKKKAAGPKAERTSVRKPAVQAKKKKAGAKKAVAKKKTGAKKAAAKKTTAKKATKKTATKAATKKKS